MLTTPQVGLYHVQGDGVGTRSPPAYTLRWSLKISSVLYWLLYLRISCQVNTDVEFFFFCIRLLESHLTKKVNTAFISHHMQIHQQSVGRAINSAQSCDDGIVALTLAALPLWTSIAIFWIKNWHALLSPVCSTTREPIRRTNERAQVPHTQTGENWKLLVRVEYFLTLADSA